MAGSDCKLASQGCVINISAIQYLELTLLGDVTEFGNGVLVVRYMLSQLETPYGCHSY